MKQNERLLVYAVTGFLALILVIAVLFGNESKAGDKQGKQGKDLQNLSDLLQPEGQAKAGAQNELGGGVEKILDLTGEHGLAGQNGGLSGIAPPNAVVPEQPLIARPQLAAEFVAQKLGYSRRDHNVRFVRVGRGDSLESLVRRWCGARDPFLDEARCLNEELQANRLQLGQEVGLPWVEDETLMTLIEQQAPRTLVSELVGGAANAGQPLGYDRVDPSRSGGSDGSGRIALPEFAMPGGRAEPGAVNTDGSGVAANVGGAANAGSIAGTTTYTVVAGDSLWKIAAKQYGKGKADQMVREMLSLNPGLSENLKVGQKFQLPAVR